MTSLLTSVRELDKHAGSDILLSSIQGKDGAIIVDGFELLILSNAFTHRDWYSLNVILSCGRDSDSLNSILITGIFAAK